MAYRADFVVYGAIVAALAGLLAWRGGPVAVEGAWVAVGLALWTLLEYLLHRFVLHGLQPFRRWHAEHHQRPTALIGLPTLGSVTLFGTLVLAPAWWVGGPWHAIALTLGVLLGYLAYAATHHADHHASAATGWMRRRQRWHAWHHQARQRPQCFGVTTALWDRLLGSGPPAR